MTRIVPFDYNSLPAHLIEQISKEVNEILFANGIEKGRVYSGVTTFDEIQANILSRKLREDEKKQYEQLVNQFVNDGEDCTGADVVGSTPLDS